MLFISAEQLLSKRIIEEQRIEYKSGFNPTAIMHTICAFANDIENVGGGYIVLGVEDDNGMPKYPIKGLNKTEIDKFQNELLGFCNQFEPRYIPEVQVDEFMGKTLLLIWCPAGYGRPYKISDDVFKKSGKFYYIRKLGRTIKAKSEEEKMLFDISSSIPFDDRANLLASINDLDINLIRQYYKNVRSKNITLIESLPLLDLCEDLKIVSGPSENMHPLNIGVLMFATNPEQFIKGARIELVNMPEQTGKNMNERIFSGPIDFQLRSALSYLKNSVIEEKVIKLDYDEEAVRIYNYPYPALEELLTNAVYHKSYEINEPITVTVTKRYIEITSIPGFDVSISDDDIKNLNIKSKRYRNRRIGDFFKELRLSEGRNTGIPNALMSLDQNGSRPVEFLMDEQRNYLTARIYINDEFVEEEIVKQTRLSRSAIRKNVLDAFKIDDEMSINSLATSLNYKGISKTLSAVVDELICDGYFVRTKKSGANAKIKRIK